MDNALDCGVKELDFWDMTVGEVQRAIQSRNRVWKMQAQEKASYDYALANLIGIYVARVLDGKNNVTIPAINEVYPWAFDSQEEAQKEAEEKKHQQKMELSALRFKQFAQSYNKQFKNKEVPK